MPDVVFTNNTNIDFECTVQDKIYRVKPNHEVRVLWNIGHILATKLAVQAYNLKGARARQKDYLVKYTEGMLREIDEVVVEASKVIEATPVADNKVVEYKNMNTQTLKKKAIEAGIEFDENIERADLINLLLEN